MAATQAGYFSLQEFSDAGALLATGRLYTYVYGTTTQKTAYTDAAANTPHTYTSDGSGGQYIALNARGELPAPLYLTSGSYDICLKTAAGATIWTRRADPLGSVGTYTASASNASTQNITDVIAHNIPSIWDFTGCTGDGVAGHDDAIALNRAIAAGYKRILIPSPPTRWRFETPINMTSDFGLSTNCGVQLDFGASHDINYPPILIAHSGVAFDFTGSRDCEINGLDMECSAIISGSRVIPKCGLLLARVDNPTGSAADGGRHRFNNTRIMGYTTQGMVQLIGAEECTFYSPMFRQLQPGKNTVTISAYNAQSLASPFVTIAAGAQSTTKNNFYDGSYYSEGNSGSANESNFFLDSCADIDFFSPFMYCPHGLAHIQVYGVNGTSDYVRINRMRGEIASDPAAWSGATTYQVGDLVLSASVIYACILSHTNHVPPNATYWVVSSVRPNYGIVFPSAGIGRIHRGWSIESSRMDANIASVCFVDDATPSDFLMRQIDNPHNSTVFKFKSCIGGEIHHSSNYITQIAAGTADGTEFYGNTVAQTFSGTLTNCERHPTDAASTWTPADASVAGLTFTGVSGKWIYDGRFAYGSAQLTFPATGSGVNVRISLPVTALTGANGEVTISYQDYATAMTPTISGGTAYIEFFKLGGTQVVNSDLSGKTLILTFRCLV